MFDWVLNTSFEMRMEIYQKNTRFDFIHKRLLGRILGPRQFEYEINIRNTKRRMSGSIHIGNTYNILKKNRKQSIYFLPTPTFRTMAKFCEPTQFQVKILWTDEISTHAKILRTHTTHTIYAKI